MSSVEAKSHTGIDAVKSVLTVSNMSLLVSFIVLYYCLYFVLIKQNPDNVMQVTLNRYIDMLVILILTAMMGLYFYKLTSDDKHHLVTYLLTFSEHYASQPTSAISSMVIIAMFYFGVFVCRIPMTAEDKPATVGVLEFLLWMTLLVVMFFNFFDFAFSLN